MNKDNSSQINQEAFNNHKDTKFLSGLKNSIAFIAVIIGFISFLGWIISGFTHKPPKKLIQPHVIDEINMLNKDTINQIEQAKFPFDIPVIIKTVSSIPPSEIGSFATKSMKKESYWEEVRPINPLRKFFRLDRPWSTGIFVVVSAEPMLLQIRYGKNLRLNTYKAGIACGTWYNSKQRFNKININEHLEKTIKDLAHEFEQIARQSWLSRSLNSLASIVWSDVEDLLMPSDNFFTKQGVINYLKIISIVGGMRSVWWFVLVSLICYVLIWVLIKKTLLDKIILPHIKKAALRIGLEITVSGGILGTLIFGFSALIILSRGRIEDGMALSNLGLGDLRLFSINPDYFAVNGGLLVAIPIAILVFLKEFLESNVVQKSDGTLPLGCLPWGAVLFIMPRAISIFIAVYLVIQFLKIIISLAKQTE